MLGFATFDIKLKLPVISRELTRKSFDRTLLKYHVKITCIIIKEISSVKFASRLTAAGRDDLIGRNRNEESRCSEGLAVANENLFQALL